jgi:hypothetical protein
MVDTILFLCDKEIRMAGYEYKVVPFIGQMKTGLFSNEGPQTASKQLEDVIHRHVGEGWDFVEVSHINILTQPGCIASLFGVRASTLVYDQVIFRRTQ